MGHPRATRALLASLLLLGACIGGRPAAPTTVPTTTAPAPTTTEPASRLPDRLLGDPATLIIGTTDAPGSLDPADTYALHDWELLKNIGEGLLKLRPGTTELVPGVAESLPQVSEDGLTYTFRLREGVRFGDGLELTAPLYVQQLQRLLELEGEVSMLGSVYLDAVEAADDRTVVFHLKDAFAFFPQLVTGAPYLPTHPDDFPTGSLQPRPEPPVYGTGPFFISAYSRDEVVLDANPHYHGEAAGVERVVVRHFEDPASLRTALEAAEVDVAWRLLGPGDLTLLEDEEGVQVSRVGGGSIRYLLLNRTTPPTDDVRVRQAIASAIDRTGMIDRAYGGYADPLYSPVPPGFLGAAEVFAERYGAPDPEAARRLLGEAGYSEEAPAELVLAYPSSFYGLAVGEAMSALEEQLEATGLVEVELVEQEWDAHLDSVVGGGEWSLAFLGWFYDYPDPDNYVTPFVLEHVLGIGVGDPDLEDLVHQASETRDEGARSTLYLEIQETFAEEVLTLPLWIASEHVAYRDYVQGDPDLPHPEDLNIGPAIEFDYSVLRVQP